MNETEENEKVAQPEPETEAIAWDLQGEGAPFFYGIGVTTETVPILGFASGGEFFQCD